MPAVNALKESLDWSDEDLDLITGDPVRSME